MEHSQFKDKTVLITGGSGSLGHAVAKKLLTVNACKKVIIFSRDEWKQWEMRNSDPIFDHPKIRYFLGDVRDYQRLTRAFNEVDYVIHAAALKQIPMAEYNPTEFILTNVQGSMNVINAALDCGVKKVIALSTDKAVNPLNLYGATKLCADKLFVAGNSYVGARGYPSFSVVRYGNVFGSRGSVISYWLKLLKDGAQTIPITDDRMTRFWITLEQAADFVINCFSCMSGGEIFVPKIPSMRIIDLAEALAPDVKKKITGIRPGEKLHELLINSDDARHTLEFEHYYAILSELKEASIKKIHDKTQKTGKYLNENFSYTSDNNHEWMTAEQLKSWLLNFKE